MDTLDLSDFQLKYAPRAWKQERLVWTTVVQLNLVKNVNSILDALSQEMAIQATRVDSTSDIIPVINERFSEKHKLLKLRLAPLRGIQTDLERKLGSGAFEDQGQSNNNGRVRSQSTPTMNGASSTGSPVIDEDDPQVRRLPKEFYIRSNNSWKDRLKNGLKNAGRPNSGWSLQNGSGPRGGNEISLDACRRSNADLEEITSIIAGCGEDIKTLWEDEVVQRILSKRKYRVDESSGLCVLRFFNRSTAED